MTEKRYAIVRVDMIARKDSHDFVCPEHFEGINSRFVCASHYGKKYFPFAHCKDCRYGDTKEQLIRKVAQALKGTLWNDRKGMSYEEIAKGIVEFLGVE